MQVMFYRDYTAARRRVFFQLFDQTDGVTPETAEAGGQPTLWKHGGVSVGNPDVGVLVATASVHGAYYAELSAAALDTLGRHRVIYDSAATGPVDELIEVIPHPFLHDGTAQAGATSAITLAAGASAVDDIYLDAYVTVIGGTGAGQTRQITDYVGSTKVATVDQPWATQPDSTSVYIIEPGNRLASLASIWDAPVANHLVGGTFGERLNPIRRGTAQAGGANTITLDTLASAVTDFYKGAIVAIVSGTGVGQAAIITAYNGTTKVATVGQNWATQPTNSSIFMLLPLGQIPGASAPTSGEIADAVWDEPRAGHLTGTTFGGGVLLATGVAEAIADALLSRNTSGGSNAHPQVKFALAFLAGKWTDNGDGTITVYDTDDVTPLGTISYSTRVRDAIGGIDSAPSA